MENPFAALNGSPPNPEFRNPTALPDLPMPRVDWFNLDSIDGYNLQSHQQMASAQQAYINEQAADAERNYLEAQGRTERARAVAFIKASTKLHERDSAKVPGTTEEFLPNVDLAKALSQTDPAYCKALEEEAEARWQRDIWAGYASSIRTKIKMLMCLSGLTRAELEAFRT